ncbi:MAG TPA: GAF domain-containing protein [Actinomycetes bacterium]
MQVEVGELRLDHEPDAVPRARSFAADLLHSWHEAELEVDVGVLVTEVVTNALLHAGPPVLLRLVRLVDGVRIEVEDSSRALPLRSRPGTDAMTGRGIMLVEALCRAWGVEPLEFGKVVWCEVVRGDEHVAGPAADLDALLDVWGEGEEEEKRYTVHLGDVPTDLLLAAKAHIDNLVREFALAAAGAESGHSAIVPDQLARLIERVVYRFAEPRLAIKMQALAAAERGEARTTLTLQLPASAAAAAEDYLAALDEADSYARAARLLTVESPPQHRLFRHWYVESIVAQLRSAAAGDPVAPSQTFEQRLLQELGVVAEAHRATDRAARLQSVTSALAGVTTASAVAEVVIAEGVAALGASGGGLMLRSEGDRLAVPGAVGYGEALLAQLRSEGRDAELPAALAIRDGRSVWIESREARDERFPALTGLEPGTISVCAVPLILGDEVLGALRFSFDSPRLFDDDERAFVLALAGQTVQALDRAKLYEAERAARAAAEALAGRLARLQEVTAELTAAEDVDEIVDIVVTHAADALGASLATLSLLVDDETLAVVRMRGEREETRRRWATYPLEGQLPGSEAVRANRPVVVRSRDELERRYPLLAGQAPHDAVLVCLPLSVGERRLGVISLSFSPGYDADDPAQLGALTTLADSSAQAIDRARALARARAATGKLAFLAEASSQLAGSLDYRTTMESVARLVVPRLADWCSVQALEDGVMQTLAVTHTDPAKVAYAEELSRRYPDDPASTTGVHNVVRTGRSELYSEVTDDMLVAAAADDEHLRILRELGLTSVIIVPLVGRSGPFGAITMVAAESGRHYDETDLAFAEDLASRAAVAVENADAYSQQRGRLAAITRVAEVAQHAILAPVPERLGPLRLAAAYVSAASDALVGGDLYEVVPRGDAVWMVIGDVRGKGLEAVRMATVVLGAFRSLAHDSDDLPEVARQMDARLRPYLGDEDFVTALLAEVCSDGSCKVVTCGHPPALLSTGGRLITLGEPDSPPLGLGAAPRAVTARLRPGDRLLLHTDGLVEARVPGGGFVDLADMVRALASGPLDTVLDRILDTLRAAVGQDLADDLGLLLAEYDPAGP